MVPMRLNRWITQYDPGNDTRFGFADSRSSCGSRFSAAASLFLFFTCLLLIPFLILGFVSSNCLLAFCFWNLFQPFFEMLPSCSLASFCDYMTVGGNDAPPYASHHGTLTQNLNVNFDPCSGSAPHYIVIRPISNCNILSRPDVSYWVEFIFLGWIYLWRGWIIVAG